MRPASPPGDPGTAAATPPVGDTGHLTSQTRGSAREVLLAFLHLGLTAFGGPVAHVGYFRLAFVVRRGWLDEQRFAELLALCQFLPGPASSQLGFAIGLLRAGWRGALAAFVGFTLPSALLMFGFALLTPRFDVGLGPAVLHGLKLVAVVVVAHAVFAMARPLSADPKRLLMAAGAAVLLLCGDPAWLMLPALVAGALLGLACCRVQPAGAMPALMPPHGPRAAALCLLIFLLGLAAALAWPAGGAASSAGLAARFYQAGALVFGGGHVVLPLLEQGVVAPGWVTREAFLAGYGAAQAVPGPMFTLAAYLGAEAAPGGAVAGAALLAVGMVFLPGFLLVLAVLPGWARWSQQVRAQRAMAGIQAAVVGVLAATLVDTVWPAGVQRASDVGIVLIGFTLLAGLRLPAWAVVLCCVGLNLGVELPGSPLVRHA